MRTLLSPSLHAGFEVLHAQREVFLPVLQYASGRTLWGRPSDSSWAVGDSLLHLCKTMRVYNILIRGSWPVLFPIAWLFQGRPFERGMRDIFAEYEAAGKRMKATPLLTPRRPDRWPSTQELWEQLEKETSKMEDTLARTPEEVAGHFRVFDPRIGSPNLIQRVQLLGFHERHHFKIMERLITAGGTRL